MIEINNMAVSSKLWVYEAASLLMEAFPHSWQSINEGVEEVEECIKYGKIALAAVEDGHVVGFAGANPRYGTTGWEMHPLVVANSYRRKGVGSCLVQAVEKEVMSKGGVMIYLGTDDESGLTSLSNCDLFVSTFEKIENIRNLNNHPFEFYQKQGYKIVGVLPDANGIGKPDIWMAKRLV